MPSPLRLNPPNPRIHSFTGCLSAARRHQRNILVQPPDILLKHIPPERHERQQIDLIQDQQVRFFDDVGVFGGFVVAASGAENADFGVLAKIKTDRANQVADVFDDQDVQLADIDFLHGLQDVMGFKMAAFAGVDLHHVFGKDGHTVGVALGGQIADDHAQAVFAGQALEGLFHQQGFTALAGAHGALYGTQQIDPAAAALLLRARPAGALAIALLRLQIGFCQPLERALKNVDGGVLVDHLLALGAADIDVDQRALDCGGREPLVPERDRQLGLLREIAREG